MKPIILASASKIRAQLLANAGIEFSISPAKIDERQIEQKFQETKTSVREIARALAEAKARHIASKNPASIVIGADQTLQCEGQQLHKPESTDQAKLQLKSLRNKTHFLHSAIVCVKDNSAPWYHVTTVALTMRNFTDTFLNEYLSVAGSQILSSVGAYQIEGRGIQLFEKIDGDLFSIQGLPLLPLLDFLRQQEEGTKE